MDSHIKQAVKVLNDGGIVIFPTDTAYGIGCRMDNPHTIDRLFSIRNRPLAQATPVLVSSKNMAESYFVHPHPNVHKLMDTYWPGALTIISACDPSSIYGLVHGNTGLIGLRMPDHAAILSMISECVVGILGPSANIHGQPTPYRFEDLNPDLMAKADYVIKGECTVKQASTVVSCDADGALTIVRHGAITLDSLI